LAQKLRAAGLKRMSELLIEIENGVASLTLNRPEQRNALSPTLLHALREAFRELQSNPKARVITLTGSGDQVFCAGADLKAARAANSAAEASPGKHESGPTRSSGEKSSSRSDFKNLLLEIQNCTKPTVALARGHVMAGGLGLFLACDLALACDDIHFSTPEINVGMFPMMVLGLLLPIVGRKRAIEMAFLGEKVSAKDALSYRMLNHVYSREEFESASREFVQELASKSSAILRIGKNAIHSIENLALKDSLTALESALEQVMKSEDSKEGIRAFIEKRKPQWKDQ
jgi:enoyl-CoA hydratase